jgi:TATA-box binding protein (TBP) (component of TFIID and TFIIIB)
VYNTLTLNKKESTMNLSDKLSKADDSVSIQIFDNGFMVEVGGRNAEDDWATAKIMCATLDEVNAVVAEAAEMERS